MSKMTSTRVVAKSFKWYEQKFGYWVILGYCVLVLSTVTVLKPYLDPLQLSNLQVSMGTGDHTKLILEDTNSSQKSKQSSSQPSKNLQVLKGTSHTEVVAEESKGSQQSNLGSSKPSVEVSGEKITLKQERKPLCDVSNPTFDHCDVEGDVRIQSKSSIIFEASSHLGAMGGNESWFIKPYPRKEDQNAMQFVRKFSVKATVSHEEAQPCTVHHSVPAIVFSAGGYSGNHFHSWNDVIIPLYATSAQFHGEVQFLVANLNKYWFSKYQTIVKQLTRYEIINIDTDDNVHCFPRMLVGLKYYKELRIDPLSSNGYSIKMFRKLMMETFSLKRSTAIKIDSDTQEKPRLLIISRKGSRSFMNVDELAEMSKSLGYEVVVTEGMTNFAEFSLVVNSCDVMLGVHGAGLTNLIFLPSNAIVIQVLPWGGFEWLGSKSFGEPALEMGLRYLKYKIKEEESSLIQQYPRDHPIIKDPYSIHKNNWGLFKSVYLDKQNVNIDVGRFKATLLEALELLHN